MRSLTQQAVLAGMMFLLAACSPRADRSLPEGLVPVPGGRAELGSAAARDFGGPRTVHLAPYAVARHEVTVAQYCRFLDAGHEDRGVEHPQVVLRDGRHRPRPGEESKAIGYVSYDDTEAYCRWLSGVARMPCRLPTADEWEHAAGAGVPGAPYPWGWGHPRGRAAFDLEGPLRVGLFAPNARGLYDIAGGVAEWCLSEDEPSDLRTARGGSWAERDPEQLTVYGGVRLPRSYRDADIGFRIAADMRGDEVAPAEAHR